MATATKDKPANGNVTKFEDKTIEYTPLAEAEPISISVAMVKNMLAIRSKSGREPTPRDITNYMMLCKSRKLNPFVGDAYLLGYDSQDGTNWSLITAVQALRKRAEAHPDYDGCQRGVIVERDGELVEREGSITLKGETLIGGWAVCKRKGQSLPYRETVNLSVYSTGRSRWSKDPAGMIVKCAESAALRRAFPSDLAGLYLREEFESEEKPITQVQEARGIEGLRNRLTTTFAAPVANPDESYQPTPDDVVDAPAPDDAIQAPPDESAIYKHFRSTLAAQKDSKGRKATLEDARKQCSDEQMMGLESFAEELATAK
jgi:phage recombination protein Bet